MARTDEELTRIAEALNRVETAGGARVAIGETLKAVGRAYEPAGDIDNDDLSASYVRQLDDVRVNLERAFKSIVATGNQDYRAEWRRPGIGGFDLCKRAYVVIAGAEAAAEWEPRTSNLQILLEALGAAPSLFGETVGKAVSAVAEAAGKAAAAAGKGLGFGGLFYVVIIVAVVALVVTRGGIIGQARALLKGAA